LDQSVALENLILPEMAKVIADLESSESNRPTKPILDDEEMRVPSLSDK